MRRKTLFTTTALLAVLFVVCVRCLWRTPDVTPTRSVVLHTATPAPLSAMAAPMPQNTPDAPQLDAKIIPLPLSLARVPPQWATTPQSILLKSAQLVDQRIEGPDAKGQVRRIEVYRTTSFKYALVRIEEWFAPAAAGEAKLLRREFSVADHVMVRFPETMDEASVKAWAASNGFTVRKKLHSAPVYLVATARSDVDAADSVMTAYQKSFQQSVPTYAERDYIVFASVIPNDTSFPTLWGMNNTGQSGGVADADIDAPEAWDITTGSRSTLVGIIDTGFDRTHPDLAANAWVNPREIPGNGIDDDHNGFVDDVQGWDFYNDDNDPMDDNKHGTHCAGTIGGVGGNGIGVAGVCWQVSIVGLKFLSGSGSGSTSDAVDATYYATRIGVALTSNSWGGGGFTQTLKDAIDAAGAANILFVAAAGNDSADNNTYLSYPASYTSANIVSVAATTRTDALAYFSNYGATTVDLGAPGMEIYSTVPGAAYATLSGTSMATPHVAGALALVKSAAPNLTAAVLKQRLLATTDPVPALSGRCVSGGRLNIGRFLLQSAGPLPTISSTVITEGAGANGDGILNPGEQILIGITVTNRGTEIAPNVTATLSTRAGSQFTISQSNLTIGTLAIGASSTPTGTLVLQSLSNTTTPHLEDLTITLTFGTPVKQLPSTLRLRINTTSHIAGRVTEVASSNPINGAKVSFDGPTAGVVTTNALGDYDFAAIDGTYAMKAYSPGYLQSASQSVSVPPNRNGVNFALQLPNLNLQPPSISLRLNSGDVLQQTVTLGNRGAIPLTWDLRLASESTTAAARNYHLPALPAAKDAPDRKSGSATAMVSNFGIEPISQGVETLLSALTGVRVGFLIGKDASTIQADVTQRGATISSMSLPLTAAALNAVDVVVLDDLLTNMSSNDVSVLSTWLRAGGGLLMEGDDSSSMRPLNSILQGTGLVGTYRGYYDVTITDIRPHAITQGITSIFESAAGVTFGVSGNAITLAAESTGAVHAAVSRLDLGVVIVVGNEITHSSNFGTGQARQLANQMIDYLALTTEPVWVSASTKTGTVPVGGTGSVVFAFDSSNLLGGDYLASGLFANNDPAAPEVKLPILMHVVGTPAIHLDRTTLAFGHRVVGNNGELNLTVTNTGTDQLDVTALTLRGPNAGNFAINPGTAFSLAPGGRKVLSVQFNGSAVGDFAAELVIDSNAASSAEIVVPLTATRVPAPKIVVTPGGVVNFKMRQGELRAATFVIKNMGKGTLDWEAGMDDVLAGGTAPEGIRLTPASGSVAPGRQTTMVVSADSSIIQSSTLQHLLHIISQDPANSDLTRAITITVQPAAFVGLSPSELRFPTTFNYGASSLAVTISNPGAMPLLLKGSFASNPAFSVQSPRWPLTLAPGEQRQLQVLFRPTKLGTQSGQLVFSSNAVSVRTGVPVTGESIQGPIAGISPSSYSIKIDPGEVQTRTLSLNNTGGAPLDWSLKATQKSGANAVIATLIPDHGTTTAGATSIAMMRLDATNIAAGAYSYTTVATTNDPLHPTLRVPLTITVSSNSNLTVSPLALAFPDTYVGARPWTYFEISNTGNFPLTVLTLTSSESAFQLLTEHAPLTLAVGEVRRIGINFMPTQAASYTGTIDLTTDSTLVPSVHVAVRGRALPPPIASLDKNLLTVTADPTGPTIRGFVLSNTGDSPLQWSAVLFGAANCATLRQSSGTVPAHSTQSLDTTFAPNYHNAPGPYTGTIKLTTDDPLHPTFTVNIGLTITGMPVLAFTPKSVTFPSIVAHTQTELSLAIHNRGNVPLVITAARSSMAEFTLSDVTFPQTIGPGLTLTKAKVRFSPNAVDTFTGTLTFDSNMVGQPQTALTVTGMATAGPEIAIAPARLTETIDPSQTVTRTLTISNAGGAALTWSTAKTPTVFFQEERSGAHSSVHLPAMQVTVHDPDQEATSAPFVAEVAPLEASLGSLMGVKIGVLVSNSSGAVLSDAKLRGAGVSSLSRPLTSALLASYHLIIWDDTMSSLTSTEVADVRAWVSAGNGILFEGDDNSVPSSNSVLAGTGVSIITSGNYQSFLTTAISPHATTAGVTSLSQSSVGSSLSVSSANAVTTVRYSTGGPILAAATSLGLGRIYVVGNEIIDYSTTQERLWGNQIIDWLATRTASGVSAQVVPSSGQVVAAGSASVLVTLSAPADALAGVHTGSLVFTSDATVNSTVTVPLTLTVTDKPFIELTPTSITFPTTFAYGQAQASVTVRNKGNASLIITAASSNAAEFTLSGMTFPVTVPSNTAVGGTIHFQPQSVGTFNGAFTFTSNTTGPAQTALPVSGIAVAGPEIGIAPTRADESLDPSQTVTRQVTISNTGAAPLHWSAVNHISTEMQGSVTPTSGTIPANGSANVTLTIAVTSTAQAGLHAGGITFTSDDPQHASRAFPLAVTVSSKPLIGLAPTSFTFPSTYRYGEATAVLTIRNTGNAPLIVSAVSISDAAFDLAGVTLPFTVPVNVATAATVRFRPVSVGSYTAILTLDSNDPTNPHATLPVSGQATAGPQLVLAPGSFTESMDLNQTVTRSLTINNTGPVPLNWSITYPLSAFQSTTTRIRYLYTLPAAPSIGTGPDMLHADLTQAQTKTDIGALDAALAPLTGVNVGVVVYNSTGPFFTDIAQRGATVTTLSRPITASQLALYHIVILDDASGNLTSAEVADLRTWVSAGHGLLLDGDDNSVAGSNNILAGTGINITSSSNFHDFTTTAISTHPTTLGMTSLHQSSAGSNLAVTGSATTVIQESAGGPIFAAATTLGSGLVFVAGNEVVDSANFSPGDGRLFANQIIDWLATSSASGVKITASSASGQVAAGGTTEVSVEIAVLKGTDAGQHLGSIDFTSDDPQHTSLSVPVSVTVASHPVINATPTSLTFPSVFTFGTSQATLHLQNTGNGPLTISAIASSNASFAATGITLPLTINRNTTLDLALTYAPLTAGTHNASLALTSDDTSTPQLVVALQGTATLGPDVTITPSNITETLDPSGNVTRALNIANADGASLNWTASLQNVSGGPGSPTGTIVQVLQRLNTAAASLTALVPNLYSFSEGITGDNINDGGNDMFDNGNFLNTSLASNLLYSDGVVATHAAVGTGGSYFTRKNTGLFTFVGDLVGATSFFITGNVGADGSGSASGAVLTSSYSGVAYKGFIKRINGTDDPSVNHLIIVEDQPSLVHSFSTNTDNDQHAVTGLTGTTRLYYLLFASASGGNVPDATFQSIMDNFVANVALPRIPSWISLSSTSGSTAPGGSSTLNCTLSATGRAAGNYTATIRLTSNDPRHNIIDVPVALTIRSAITLAQPTASLDAGADPISFTTGGASLAVPITVEGINDQNIVKLEADQTLSVIYGLSRDTAAPHNGKLIWIDASTGSVTHILALGAPVLDFTHHPIDDHLYALLGDGITVKVIARQGQRNVLSTYSVGINSRALAAGIAARLIVQNGSSVTSMFDSASGSLITSLSPLPSDIMINPLSGSFYAIHEGTVSSNTEVATSPITSSAFFNSVRSRDNFTAPRTLPLVVSTNNQRLFFNGLCVRTTDLSTIRDLGTTIYAASPNAAIAYSANAALDAHTGTSLQTLPFSTSLMAASADGRHLIMYNPAARTFTSVASPSPSATAADIDADGVIDISPLVPLTSASADGTARTFAYNRRSGFASAVNAIEASHDHGQTWTILSRELDYTEDSITPASAEFETVTLTFLGEDIGNWQFRLTPQP